MKRLLCAALLFPAGLGYGQDAPAKKEPAAKEEKLDKKTPLKVLAPEELEKVLQRRLNGTLGYSFQQFANLFLVRSGQNTGCHVGLSARDEAIAKTELQPVFPPAYEPTLRELLDTITLQTSSAWSYRKEDQFASSKAEEKEPQGDVIIISFEKTQRAKPYEFTLAKDWKSEDRGHWTACIPSTAPVGMDIYESGTYTARDKAKEPELLERVRTEVALQWAQRVKQDAIAAHLKPAKVGPFDALFFDAMLKARNGAQVHWRHWVFMAGNQCYFIVSTIFPEGEKTLLPDVEGMLKTFRIKAP